MVEIEKVVRKDSMDSLGDRIKQYEEVYQYKLTPRSCLFIRVDGKAFHTYTRNFKRPFDWTLMDAMTTAACKTAEEMQGFKGAFVQSDEATFMLTDFDTLQTQGWFGYELAKVISISASAFTAHFNQYMLDKYVQQPTPAMFDSRAFIVPKEDAANVFIWRQKDWTRNSIQMLARMHFSHKELNQKSVSGMHEMLHTKGINWADLAPQEKNGTFIDKHGLKRYEPWTYETLSEHLFPVVEDL